jgi:hypothetical protein
MLSVPGSRSWKFFVEGIGSANPTQGSLGRDRTDDLRGGTDSHIKVSSVCLSVFGSEMPRLHTLKDCGPLSHNGLILYLAQIVAFEPPDVDCSGKVSSGSASSAAEPRSRQNDVPARLLRSTRSRRCTESLVESCSMHSIFQTTAAKVLLRQARAYISIPLPTAGRRAATAEFREGPSSAAPALSAPLSTGDSTSRAPTMASDASSATGLAAPS